MLTISVENLGEAVLLHCAGKIVRGHETSLLCSAAQQQGRNVFLDLSAVESIDAAGIGALVSLQAAGIYLKLMNPTETVLKVLKVTKLNSIFEIHSSESIGREMAPATSHQQADALRASA